MVSVNGRDSKAFGVKVGVNQGSVLSSLRFVIVLDALWREVMDGLPMELLYADDSVLMAETEELLVENIQKWKNMEEKGLKSKLRQDKGYEREATDVGLG